MRLRDLTREEMSEAQQKVVDEAVSGKRGRMPAPLRAWIHSPEMGAHAQRLGELLRYGTILGPRLSELAILITARFWTSHYEWFAHKREGLRAGLDPAIIEAIAARKEPPLDDPKAKAIYAYVVMLHNEHAVSDDVHAAVVREFGERGVVELVGLLGYYTLVAMTLNAFEIGLPPGEPMELKA